MQRFLQKAHFKIYYVWIILNIYHTYMELPFFSMSLSCLQQFPSCAPNIRLHNIHTAVQLVIALNVWLQCFSCLKMRLTIMWWRAETISLYIPRLCHPSTAHCTEQTLKKVLFSFSSTTSFPFLNYFPLSFLLNSN